ncbi:hypothetical protein MCC10015_1618 [Bifidobacterium longum subsp. longum]|uniref:Uncharacterized protein n=1 Tax=Bifidobacterium longum subsp. longum TaxID=1679 RepID=A0A4R0T1F0_BIFLL|nr:hypothetical protein MCC10015_1618 [Bifidobacterium longum subsp. longum]
MLIPSDYGHFYYHGPSLSRRVNANSQHERYRTLDMDKLIKKGEC